MDDEIPAGLDLEKDTDPQDDNKGEAPVDSQELPMFIS